MNRLGFSIDFKCINDHRINDIKTRFGDLILKEIRKKKIDWGNLQRQLKSFGYEYPIFRVIKNDDQLRSYPIEVYAVLMVLVGINIYISPNDELNNSKRYIKNRNRIKSNYEMNN